MYPLPIRVYTFTLYNITASQHTTTITTYRRLPSIVVDFMILISSYIVRLRLRRWIIVTQGYKGTLLVSQRFYLIPSTLYLIPYSLHPYLIPSTLYLIHYTFYLIAYNFYPLPSILYSIIVSICTHRPYFKRYQGILYICVLLRNWVGLP